MLGGCSLASTGTPGRIWSRSRGGNAIDSDLDRLREELAAATRTGVVPGVALALGIGETCIARLVYGSAERVPGVDRQLSLDTLFDLASLTKVMATAPAVLCLVDRGLLSLDDPLGRYDPSFRGDGRERIQLHHLLTHTAGLLASRRYYQWCSTASELRRAVRAESTVAAPGEQVIYSDLGYLLLGDVVETVTGLRLDRACVALLYDPLGLPKTRFRPMDDPVTSADPVAATQEPGNEAGVGVPHDGNARAARGVAGHAGLFAPIDDVARYAAWWSGRREGPISAAIRADSMRCHTDGLGGRRGLSWVARGDVSDFLGDQWSSSTVTHTGFTGTSIAVDPDRGWWVCLLTNAIHFGRGRPEVARLRTKVHRLAASLLEQSAGADSHGLL
jgi:CubicO group peptidase (beta-lactamase class C family)